MPKENGPFFAAFMGAAYAEMPRYDTEVLSSASDEFVVYDENGRYSLSASPYVGSSCIRVYDGYAIAGCFECDGAQATCSDDPQCPSGYIDTVPINSRVRLLSDGDNVQSHYCASPKLGSADYGGFCLSYHYNDDRIYSPLPSGNVYKLGDYRVYYVDGNGGACYEQLENASSTYYCSSGYYLSGTTCSRCPNGAVTGISGYHSYGQSRACAAAVVVNCTNAQYNGANYHLSTKTCLTCPTGAKCDGEYVYCPAGSYVFSNGKDAPTCVSCPNGGSVMNTYTDTLGDCTDGYDGSMGIPNHLFYGYSIGMDTPCKWTDSIETDASNCAKLGGSDATGTYIFQQDNQFEPCYY